MPEIIRPNSIYPSGQGIVRIPASRLLGGEVAPVANPTSNIEIGTDTFGYGWRGNPGMYATTTNDNTNPSPPDVGADSFLQLSQFSSGLWEIRFTPAIVPQNAWTSINIITPSLSDVSFTSAACAYVADSFGSSRWRFTTAIRWHNLANGTPVSCTFS